VQKNYRPVPVSVLPACAISALRATESVMGESFINLGIVPGDVGAWFLCAF
jgi:hypothetical protein